MHEISPMHLNTSPASFESSGTEQHEKNKHETLTNSGPEKTARYGVPNQAYR